MKIIWKRMCHTIKRYPLLFVKSTFMVSVITFFNILIPYGMRSFIDRISLQKDTVFICMGIVGFLAIMLINTIFEIKWYVILDEFGGKCIDDLTISVEESLFHTCQNKIDATGQEIVKHTLYADILDVFRVIGHHIPCLLGNIITIIVCLVVASNYDGLLTLYIALATLGGMGISLASRRIIAAKARNTNGKLKKHHALCDQYVEMLPTAKTNDLLSYYTEKSSSSISDFIRTSQKEDWTTIFWTRTVSNYNLLISILLSVFLIVLSADSTVNLVFFSMVAGIINSQSQSAELLFQQIVKAEVSFENVERLCEFPSIYGDKGLNEVTSLSFRKVSFVYQSVPYKNILQDITCSFKPGDLVMLKGENGSGKSTFIKLITGLYAPTEGKILINGQDHFSYSHRDLNKQILYIGQEEKFLNESFVDYMRIITGEESFSLTEWEEWMEKLGLSLSDRNIEACGENLSVGQRKKLLILKMMQRVREASVIILDEVMAGLDTGTQEIFIEYVKQLSQTGEKIIFLIEHSEKCGLEVSHELEFKNGMIIK